MATEASMTASRRAVAVALSVVVSAVGILALLWFWRRVLHEEDFASLSLPLVALVAATAATFNPCSLPALPGFVAAAGAAGGEVPTRRRVQLSVASALGAAAVVAVLGLVVAAFGSQTKDLVEPNFRWVQLVIGLVLVAVAALHLAGQTSRLPLVGSLTRAGARAWEVGLERQGPASAFGWGAGFVAVGAG